MTIQIRIRLPSDDGGTAAFTGEYAVLTELEAVDTSVLGRDIQQMFATMVG